MWYELKNQELIPIYSQICSLQVIIIFLLFQTHLYFLSTVTLNRFLKVYKNKKKWCFQCSSIPLTNLIQQILFKQNISSMSSGFSTPRRKDSKQFTHKQISKRRHLKSSIFHRLFHRGQDYIIRGYESESFNRRKYEGPIQSLRNVTKSNLGFTNDIVMLKDDEKKSLQLFVPAYVSLKVKSIQQIEIKDLIAEINCVLIIILLIDELPDELKRLLESNIMVQVNRGDSFQLVMKEDSTKIKMKKQGKFVKFIVREVFPVQIYDEVFLSPFQILNLVLTVTINSIFTPPQLSPLKGYKCQISFNCMRNPEKISISYVSQCRLGVYDLAEKKLVHYPSNLATYDEIRNQFITYMEGKKPKIVWNHHQEVKEVGFKDYNIQSEERKGIERLQLRSSKVQKKSTEKIKYYEYSHFVVPVYKFPGNAWATIFIPIIMLGILSISMFFYQASPAQQIGTIATIVLGFIALIPSIKDQLPPSQRITLSEIIVYIEAINCMLSLSENIFKVTRSRQLYKNKLFMFSLCLHLICIGIAFSLLILHKFWWEPSYNSSEKAIQLSPVDDKDAWNNPYCDQYFLKYNTSNANRIVKFQKEKLAIKQ